MNLSARLLFIAVIAASVILREIRAREAITPSPEVGQIIKDLDGLHIDGTGTAWRQGASCKVDVQRDLPPPRLFQPLYLQPNTSLYWLPNANGQLEIPSGHPIELYCRGNFSEIAEYSESIQPKCLQGTTFELNGSKLEFRKFTCSQSMTYTVEKLESSCGSSPSPADQSHLYRVGYDIGRGRFVETMKLCHNPQTVRTHYAVHQLTPASQHFQQKVKRPKFTTAGHFEGYDMNNIYSFKNQQSLLGGLVNEKENQFLSRGHLVAKADLIYASQQRSSFNYMNTAPQWQLFNAGSWQNLEEATRRFVANAGIEVEVYTGTYGQMPFPNASAVVHLATDTNKRQVLQVPRLFYRVLIDKVNRRRGIALVGVNSPNAILSEIKDPNVICDPIDPIEEKVPWLDWVAKANKKRRLLMQGGYLYVCSVSDLAGAVKELPNHLGDVSELLK
ncbi:uncharacterized protein LOC108165557 [Drosophila miranda]|uniref:uncharacterized protein LOC108165557 n=1 Tax=Drosophila miranda TaxID=7229 RepID=UPI0007E743D0|nr:uncharacterized protein LOC108165557 [Drosophila miranda]